MPLYEYLCEKCGSKFELIEKFSDTPKTVHEGCGGAVHRLVSAPALQFKGTGFYITDYAKSGSSKGDSRKSDESKSSDSKSKESKSSDSSSATPAAAPASSTTSSSSSSDSSSGASKS